jgi:aspartate aminotransferase
MLPKSPIDNDIAFVEWLRDEQRVLVVAGRSFGAPGYFRISFCVTDRELEGSLKGFKAAALKYGLG